MVFVLGYVSHDGTFSEPLGTAFSVSPRFVFTASSLVDNSDLPPGRFLVSPQVIRSSNPMGRGQFEFMQPRFLRLVRSGPDGWAMLDLDLPPAASSSVLSASSETIKNTGEGALKEEGGLEGDGAIAEMLFPQFLQICPSSQLPQPNREEGHLLSVHQAPVSWFRKICASEGAAVDSLRIWSSFGRQVLQRDGGTTAQGLGMGMGLGLSSPGLGGGGALGDSRLLVQGGPTLGSAGAPFVNDVGQVVALQLASYHDLDLTSPTHAAASSSTLALSSAASSVVCVGLLLSTVPEIEEWARSERQGDSSQA